MKRILRILRNTLLAISFIIVGLLIFLIIYYYIQEYKLREKDEKLLQNSHTSVIQGDSINIAAEPALKLIPVPRKAVLTEGYYQFPENLTYTVTDSLQASVANIAADFPELNPVFSDKQGDILISYASGIPRQGYRLEIQPGRININFSDLRGLYYAFVSLKILNSNHNGLIPCAVIDDHPDLETRGLMLDISRDKVPLKGALLKTARMLADLKYNHLELYVEGFSFAYPGYRDLWKNETPITGEEIQELDSFCRANFIELVPNQNSLGHMTAWLATDEFSDLAECPDGYMLLGLMKTKGTLDPADERSLKLVTSLTDELLPNFSSDKFNVNLDEPFELGKGKNKKRAKKIGVQGIYLDYTLKMHQMVAERDKEMLMWADIVIRHPGILKKLPEDITLLDWGYEAGYPFETHCKMLRQSGHKFMVCPGTSSWTSITGRTNNMLGNIASATSNGVKYGATGMLLTDWGDMGHWQYLPVSYAGYVTGSALSWNNSSMYEFPLISFLNDYVFKDNRKIMGDLALDLGRYLSYEEIPVPNMTTTMLTLQFGMNDRIVNYALYEKLGREISALMNENAPEMAESYLEKLESSTPFDYAGLFSFLDEKEDLLRNAAMAGEDNNLIAAEYRNAIRLIRLGGNLQYYIEKSSGLSRQERLEELISLKKTLEQYLQENSRLWHIRNKPGGYERSTAVLNKLLITLEEQIIKLRKPVIARWTDRIKEVLRASAATLYIKHA